MNKKLTEEQQANLEELVSVVMEVIGINNSITSLLNHTGIDTYQLMGMVRNNTPDEQMQEVYENIFTSLDVSHTMLGGVIATIGSIVDNMREDKECYQSYKPN